MLIPFRRVLNSGRNRVYFPRGHMAMFSPGNWWLLDTAHYNYTDRAALITLTASATLHNNGRNQFPKRAETGKVGVKLCGIRGK